MYFTTLSAFLSVFCKTGRGNSIHFHYIEPSDVVRLPSVINHLPDRCHIMTALVQIPSQRWRYHDAVNRDNRGI